MTCKGCKERVAKKIILFFLETHSIGDALFVYRGKLGTVNYIIPRVVLYVKSEFVKNANKYDKNDLYQVEVSDKVLKIETARKWGGTVLVPLTHFIKEGNTVQNAKLNGEDVIVLKELKLKNK